MKWFYEMIPQGVTKVEEIFLEIKWAKIMKKIREMAKEFFS